MKVAMTNRYCVQLSVRNTYMMTRIAELFEEQARSLGEDEEAVNWREMAYICRQQFEGRRGVRRVIRPALNTIRWDVVEQAMAGCAPYPRLSMLEAQEVCRQLTEEGRSIRYIADRVEAHWRTVSRWRRQDKNNK